MKFTFPKDFMFGAATSAVQIEGGIHEGGKGEDFHSDNYKKNPALYKYSDPAKNADFYHKYPEDIKMMKDLGLKCFRFSISWSRIFPDGPYKVCQEGVDYYNRVIDELKKNGIKAFFDLWHCDMPLWLVKLGALTNSSFVDWFSYYAKTCFEAFGDRVDYWCTVNEPNINCVSKEAGGDKYTFFNMMMAHYQAVKIYKSMNLPGQIGAVIHVIPYYSLSMDKKDADAADRAMAFYAGRGLDPMYKGYYPEVLLKEKEFINSLPPDFEKLMKENYIEADFIGVNIYGPEHVAYGEGEHYLKYKKIINKNTPKDDYGFEYYPQGIFDTLAYLSDNYPGKNIIITENGIGVKKWGNYEEELHDDYRINYMREHLRSLSRAIKAGFPVIGYFPWSIMDTSELRSGGYTLMFGLVQIRYETLERVPRDSWYFYQKVIDESRVD